MARRRMYGSHTSVIVTALWTRVCRPMRSIADCSARPLMTVASMPMLSAVGRSIPRVAAGSPRQMLPPPMTMPTSTPRATTSETCRAMLSTVVGSIPNAADPWRASPLNLRRILRYRSRPLAELAAAKLESRKAPNDDVLAQLGDRLVEQVLHSLAGIANVRLIEQRHVAVTLGRSLFPGGYAPWIGGGDLHRDLAREGLEVVSASHEVRLAVELDHRPDAARVHVAVDDALAGLAAGFLFGRREQIGRAHV